MVNTNDCWLYAGWFTDNDYGQLRTKVDGQWRSVAAHRVVYENYKGRIPDGLVMDHLCRVRQCVNPEHLEAVTLKENILRGISFSSRNKRKTHCPQGHSYSKENTYIRGGTHAGNRLCKTCRRVQHKQYRQRRATA